MSAEASALIGQLVGILIGGTLGVVLTHDPWLTLLPTFAGQIIGGFGAIRLAVTIPCL